MKSIYTQLGVIGNYGDILECPIDVIYEEYYANKICFIKLKYIFF